MIRSLLSLLLVAQTLSSAVIPPQARTVFAMKTGILLRVHVIAQDDTEEMQRIKLCVKDAVLAAYSPEEGQTMLQRTRTLLPQLAQAAQKAARAEGFTGSVQVSIEQAAFDQRTLDGLTIPAGEYPALMIRLGSARGHNWWGLIDPELAQACAALPDKTGWDWSLAAFFEALLGFPLEVLFHE
ncbi:MAG: stage II sporulation protein R [Clostridia bacterium]|nr:stage II sporulation protein R [Clostridia bacterium]